MNWASGFFRLWVLVSVLWVVGSVLIYQPWKPLITDPIVVTDGKLEIEFPADLDPDELAIKRSELPDEQRIRIVEKYRAIHRARNEVAWNDRLEWITFTIAVPLVLLSFGFAVRWIAQGFASKKT